jgi:hypothetical protein
MKKNTLLAILALIPGVCYGEISNEDIKSFCEYRMTQIEIMKETVSDNYVLYFLEGEEEAFKQVKQFIEVNQLTQ